VSRKAESSTAASCRRKIRARDKRRNEHQYGQNRQYGRSIIDILAVVRDIDRADAFNKPLMLCGYSPLGENGIAGRRYFTKGGNRKTHHLHVYGAGHPNIAKHLNFKAYLMHHPDETSAYGKLKRRLAREYPDDVRAYQNGKNGGAHAGRSVAGWLLTRTGGFQAALLGAAGAVFLGGVILAGGMRSGE
jgi:hypothetical protein